MTFAAYCKFYGLQQTAANFENWLFNEWHHGRAYRMGDTFYDVETGAVLGTCKD